MDKLLNEDFERYFLYAAALICLSGYEWWRFLYKIPPNPLPVTIALIFCVPFCVYKILKIFREAKAVKLGREGERAVGQFLESLRSNGCVVFHDIFAEKFNLDHVILSKKGIFAIETKTFKKPEKGEAKIIFNGEKIAIQGSGTYDQPLIQVKSASNWLRNTFLSTTGKSFTIKPVIVFPGWYVDVSEQGKKANIWVLNPKALPAFINNLPDSISQEDLQLAVFHLCRYVRVKESEKK